MLISVYVVIVTARIKLGCLCKHHYEEGAVIITMTKSEPNTYWMPGMVIIAFTQIIPC